MSESTTEETATTEATEAETAKPDTGSVKDWAAEAEKWKALARKHEGTAKANSEAAKRLAEIEESQKSEVEKAVAAARKEGESEATNRANARLVSAEARALAAEAKFRNPALAIRAIDLSAVKVGDDGEVDAAAIKAALEDLAKAEPYLIDEEGPKIAPSFGGGPRNTEPKRAETLSDAIAARLASKS